MSRVLLTEEDIDRIHDVAWAVSRDSARPQLTAVQLHGGYAMGTDSYRCAAVPLEHLDHDGAVWLTRAAIADLPAEGDCRLTVDNTPARDAHGCAIPAQLVAWRVGGVAVAHGLQRAQLGDPIDWQPLAERARIQSLTIPADKRAEVRVAVRACRARKAGYQPPIVIRSNLSGSVVVEGPDHQQNVHIGHTGWHIPIGVNPRYFSDLLAHHAPGDIRLHATHPAGLGPIVVTDALEVVHLLMPVRLQLEVKWEGARS